jgi:hypothetical protein
MRKMTRFSFALTFALVAGAAGVNSAAAQTTAAAPAAAATINASDAQGFLGKWGFALDAQGQAFALDLNITDEAGKVAAEISSEMGTSKVSSIVKNADKLVLTYSMDAQGQQIPVAITLAQAEGGLNADFDFAGGMFMLSGKGTKK